MKGTEAHYARFGWYAVAAACVLLLVCLVAAVLDRQLRVLAVGATVLALAFFILEERYPPFPPTGQQARILGGSRYTVVPQLLILTVVVCGCIALGRRGRLLAVPVLLGVGVPLGVAVVRDYTFHNGRSIGPTWGQAVLAATRSCERTNGPRASIKVPESPPGWNVTIPCSRLMDP